MYILASDFFKKDNKYVFKARNLCYVSRIFLNIYAFIIFFETIQMIIYIYTYEILKTRV